MLKREQRAARGTVRSPLTLLEREWLLRPGQVRPGIPLSSERKVISDDGKGAKQVEYWFRGKLVGRAAWERGEIGRVEALRGGRRHGYRFEYAWGFMDYAEPYRNGQLHGWSKQYDQKCRLIFECPFRDGTGVDYFVHDNGELSESHPCLRGELHGVQQWCAGPNAVYEETHFQRSKQHGPRRYWRNGVLEPGYPEFFVNDRKVSKAAYVKASARDRTLPQYRVEDDFPARELPAEFIRLRKRMERKSTRKRA